MAPNRVPCSPIWTHWLRIEPTHQPNRAPMLPNQEEEGVCSVRLYWNVEVSPAMVAFRGSELPQFIILLAGVFQVGYLKGFFFFFLFISFSFSVGRFDLTLCIWFHSCICVQREPLSNPMIYARTEEERRRWGWLADRPWTVWHALIFCWSLVLVLGVDLLSSNLSPRSRHGMCSCGWPLCSSALAAACSLT